MAIQFGKPLEVYGYQTLFREIGYYLSRLESYESSLKFYDEAIKKTPTDKRALIGRSKSRAKVSQYEGALSDVNKALGLDEDDLVVLAHKALNTYLCCEFEEGVVLNSRLVPKRLKPENFAEGVMQCSDAIENCLGDRTGRPLRDHFMVIRKLAWKKNYASHKPFEPKPANKPKKKKMRLLGNAPVERPELMIRPRKTKSRIIVEDPLAPTIKDSLHSKDLDYEFIPPLADEFPYRPLQSHTTNIDNYMAEKYLDSMYLDKIFLRKLTSQPGLACPNEEGSKKLRQLAKNTFKTVSYKQELLRTRRPFYFIKYQEATLSGALKARQKAVLDIQQRNTKLEAEAIMEKMTEAYQEKDLKLCLEMVKKMKQFCEVKPKKLLPDKNIYVETSLDFACKAWYDYYRINPDQSDFEQRRRIYAIFGLPMTREPSTDSVIGQFKNVFIDYKKEIADMEKKIEESNLPIAVCLYYHELSRYYIDLKKYDLSRFYARKCIHEATFLENQRWIFNCLMLLIKSNLIEHNKNDAKNDAMKALNCIQTLNDKGKITFIKKTLEVIDICEFDDIFGQKQLERREQKIIQMMASSKMKDEVAHLFRQMAAMPSSRRMVVIPGVRAEEKPVSKNRRAMSIMPTANFSNSDDSRSPSMKNSVNPKRATVMDLIEFHV